MSAICKKCGMAKRDGDDLFDDCYGQKECLERQLANTKAVGDALAEAVSAYIWEGTFDSSQAMRAALKAYKALP